jgi:hypothetical protein
MNGRDYHVQGGHPATVCYRATARIASKAAMRRLVAVVVPGLGKFEPEIDEPVAVKIERRVVQRLAHKFHDLQRLVFPLALRPDMQCKQLLGPAFHAGAPVVDAGAPESDVRKRDIARRVVEDARADQARQRGVRAQCIEYRFLSSAAEHIASLQRKTPRFLREQRQRLSLQYSARRMASS